MIQINGVSYVAVHEDLNVQHGVDNWELDDMTWHPEDGMACFMYERNIPGVGVELAIVWKEQPAHDKHVGWKLRSREEVTLGLTQRDLLRWERGIDLAPDLEVMYD